MCGAVFLNISDAVDPSEGLTDFADPLRVTHGNIYSWNRPYLQIRIVGILKLLNFLSKCRKHNKTCNFSSSNGSKTKVRSNLKERELCTT